MSVEITLFTVQSARATSAIVGIQKYFSTTASLVLAGTTYTPAEVMALLQAFAEAIRPSRPCTR